MEKILYTPPAAFIISFLFFAILAAALSRLAYRGKQGPAGGRTSYACGEDIPDHTAQPDYSQFFSFAFFFTIAHVATLMMTIIPIESLETLAMALIYVAVVVVSLMVVFKR